jgi:small subunit ribosomal protein S4
MARHTDAVCRLCRREGVKLFLKGQRCYTEKCAIDRRAYPPGQQGQARPRFSEYGVQLREKQKLKRFYGVLEAQFRNYFAWASRMKGATGENLLLLLERRLDNVLYRLGLAASRAQARQWIRHRHVLVGGRPVTIPAFLVRQGQVIEVKEKSRPGSGSIGQTAGARWSAFRPEMTLICRLTNSWWSNSILDSGHAMAMIQGAHAAQGER